VGSSTFGESDDVSVFSKAFSAEEEVILSNKTHLAFTVSAFSAVFSVVSQVSSPQQVWHLYKKNQKLLFFYFIQFFIDYHQQ
jgi:hypothetical protein